MPCLQDAAYGDLWGCCSCASEAEKILNRFRNWVFTLNNPGHGELGELVGQHGFISFLLYGRERGESGTPHLQGYLECARPVGLAHLRLLPHLARAHFEPRRGTQSQAVNYCKKDGDWLEFGRLKRQGQRSDLDAVAQAVSSGSDLAQIARHHPVEWIKYSRGIRDLEFQLKQSAATAASRSVSARVYWGDSGAGKTFSVYEEFGYDSVFKLDHQPTGVWFDGYRHQSVLLIDDFYGWIPYNFLLNMLDVYPLRLPAKGGNGWASWTTVVITSNSPPQNWYKEFCRKFSLPTNEDGIPAALARRICMIRTFSK